MKGPVQTSTGFELLRRQGAETLYLNMEYGTGPCGRCCVGPTARGRLWWKVRRRGRCTGCPFPRLPKNWWKKVRARRPRVTG